MADENKVKFRLWLIPIFLSIHNCEEALTMPQWLTVHLPKLQSAIPLFSYLHFSSTQLYLSLLLVTIIPFALTFICLRGTFTNIKVFLLLTLQSIIFWNALVPHIIGLFVLRTYNPGAVTAVTLNVPFSLYLLKEIVAEKLINENIRRKILLAGLVIYLPVVLSNHFLAQLISHL